MASVAIKELRARPCGCGMLVSMTMWL